MKNYLVMMMKMKMKMKMKRKMKKRMRKKKKKKNHRKIIKFLRKENNNTSEKPEEAIDINIDSDDAIVSNYYLKVRI